MSDDRRIFKQNAPKAIKGHATQEFSSKVGAIQSNFIIIISDVSPFSGPPCP